MSLANISPQSQVCMPPIDVPSASLRCLIAVSYTLTKGNSSAFHSDIVDWHGGNITKVCGLVTGFESGALEKGAHTVDPFRPYTSSAPPPFLLVRPRSFP
jgi:hypothetical protein